MSDIAVYADWEGLPDPTQLGWLRARPKGRTEIFEFEFLKEALDNPLFNDLYLDPRLPFIQGRQFPSADMQRFGVFSDSSPDRWGQMLMRRRLERQQRAGLIDKNFKLGESDYLIGVHDQFRVGGLRFKLNGEGNFLDDQHDQAAPPFTSLRELQQASISLENDEDNSDNAAGDWLRMLIAPGGSLGGARPKASVTHQDGSLWIAKFPSVRDERDMGAWELLVQTIALDVGLKVPESMADIFGNHKHNTFLIKRFDRTSTGKRLHFASAMTLTGHKDGEGAAEGVSYLEIAEVIINHGADTNADLRELWSRIVFNILVSNTDDHLRNHGFILVPGKGWRLSEAYDMNPEPRSDGLKLNISEYDNALDLDLALSVAHFFRLNKNEAKEIIDHFKYSVSQWRSVATGLQIPIKEQDSMAEAFRMAES